MINGKSLNKSTTSKNIDQIFLQTLIDKQIAEEQKLYAVTKKKSKNPDSFKFIFRKVQEPVQAVERTMFAEIYKYLPNKRLTEKLEIIQKNNIKKYENMQPIDHQQKEKIKIAEVKAKIRAKSNSSRFPVDKLDLKSQNKSKDKFNFVKEVKKPQHNTQVNKKPNNITLSDVNTIKKENIESGQTQKLPLLTTRLPSSIYFYEGNEKLKEKNIPEQIVKSQRDFIKNSNSCQALTCNRKIKRSHILLNDIEAGVSKNETPKYYRGKAKKSLNLKTLSAFVKKLPGVKCSSKLKTEIEDCTFQTSNLQRSFGKPSRRQIDINQLRLSSHLSWLPPLTLI